MMSPVVADDDCTRAVNAAAAAMASGSVLSDAVLAAYAIENRARLCTNDADFARFPGLGWHNPLLPA